MSVEIRLKKKYRDRKPIGGGRSSDYNGNSGVSNGKHIAHPAIHGFRKKGYCCEAKWNRHEPESTP